MSSDADNQDPDPPEVALEATESTPLPRWKKVLLICASVSVALGLVLTAVGAGGAPGDLSTSRSTQGPEGIGPAGAGFDVGTDSGDPQEAEAAEDGLGPVFLKLGFSFFVGFAIGYAFRTFLKLALIFIGVLLISLFLLSYVQWVSVNWDTMASTFEIFVDAMKDDMQAFHTFITGSLPQAGLASLGLIAGFKRN